MHKSTLGILTRYAWGVKNTSQNSTVVDRAERRKGTKEPGACVGLLEGSLDHDRAQQQ